MDIWEDLLLVGGIALIVFTLWASVTNPYAENCRKLCGKNEVWVKDGGENPPSCYCKVEGKWEIQRL